MSGVSEVTVPFTEGTATGDTPAPAAAQRPDNVPEKFWDAEKGAIRTEDLLKSYSELEKGRAPAAPANPPSEPPSDADAEAAAAVAGVSMQDLEAEFSAGGSLSEASYSKLEQAGFPKDVVDEFIQYRQANADAVQKGFMDIVGGEAEFAKIQAWAVGSFNQEQADAFNEAVNSGNKGRIETALKALKADYTAANPSRPKLISGVSDTATGGGDAYASMAQPMADQKDPRYFSDPAFRQGVMEKLKRSNVR